MQTRDVIQKIKIKNFGTIDNMFFDKFQNINLIIGENGTGKTFLLKALYTAMKTVEDYGRGDDVRSSADILADRLRWCFQTEKLGDIVKKGTDEPLIFEMVWNNKIFSYRFTESATVKASNVVNEIMPLTSNSIYIPAKEVLSLYNIILKSERWTDSSGLMIRIMIWSKPCGLHHNGDGIMIYLQNPVLCLRTLLVAE